MFVWHRFFFLFFWGSPTGRAQKFNHNVNGNTLQCEVIHFLLFLIKHWLKKGNSKTSKVDDKKILLRNRMRQKRKKNNIDRCVTYDVITEYRKIGPKVRTRTEGVLNTQDIGENGGTRWAQCWRICVCILVVIEQYFRPVEDKKAPKKLLTYGHKEHKILKT